MSIFSVMVSILLVHVQENNLSNRVCMVCFEILVEINAAKRAEFFQAFEMIKSEKVHSADRFGIDLFEQVDSANTFLWQEDWGNHESLNKYFQSNTYRMMMGAINVLGKLVHKKVCRQEEEIDNGK